MLISKKDQNQQVVVAPPGGKNCLKRKCQPYLRIWPTSKNMDSGCCVVNLSFAIPLLLHELNSQLKGEMAVNLEWPDANIQTFETQFLFHFIKKIHHNNREFCSVCKEPPWAHCIQYDKKKL